MADMVKIPGIGPVKKGYAIAGAAATAGIVGFAWYKHHQGGAGGSSAAAAGAAAGNIDPATGFPYGSPQDTAALQAQQGASANDIDPSTGYPYGSVQDQTALAALEGGAGSISSGGGGGVSTSTQIDPITGYTAGSAQDIAALQAMYGGTGTTTTGTGTGTGTTTGTGTGTTTPPAKPVATTHPAPTSYSDTPYGTYVDLGWGSVGEGLTYHYQVLTSAGAVVAQATTTALNARVQGLKPSTAYKWRVSADPNGLWTPFVSFTTKKS